MMFIATKRSYATYNNCYVQLKNLKAYRLFLPIVILMSFFACVSQVELSTNDLEERALTTTQAFNEFEKEAMGGCPISKGPLEVVDYLEGLSGYERNERFDNGNGSIRFNAEDAMINGLDLVDDKSLFLLNYNTEHPTYDGWMIFQAIYWFEKEKDYVAKYNKLVETFNMRLKLDKKIHYDILGNEYERYTLPNGSRFNLKHSDRNGKYFIDILWGPNPD